MLFGLLVEVVESLAMLFLVEEPLFKIVVDFFASGGELVVEGVEAVLLAGLRLLFLLLVCVFGFDGRACGLEGSCDLFLP